MVFVMFLAALWEQDSALPDGRPSAPPAAHAEGALPKKAGKKKSQEPPPQEDPLIPGAPRTLREEEFPRVKFRAGFDAEYNSNILRLDDRDVRRLEDGTRPDKFRIEEPDDFIFSPWVEGALEFPLGAHMALAGLRLQAHAYETNSVADYQEIHLFFKRKPFTAEYTLLPDVYRQEYRNLDTGEFESAFYQEHQLEGAVRLDVLEPVALKPFAGLRYRDYDSPFHHRDALGTFLGVRAATDLTPWLEVSLGYEFFRNEAFADDGQPDTSYVEHGLEPAVRVRPTRGVEATLAWRFDDRSYTTNNDPAADPGHRDRSDDRRRLTFEVAWKVGSGFTLEGRYRRTDVDTDLPNDPTASDEETSWERDEYLLGLTYQF